MGDCNVAVLALLRPAAEQNDDLLTVFAEIFVTTGGGPGLQTTNIAFLIYSQALIQYDVGSASAGGLVAVVIANIVAFFLVRIVGRNLEA